MHEQIALRTADRDDADLIADISRETFRDTFGASNTEADMDLFLSTQFTHARLAAEVGQPGHVFLLATAGQTVAGYIFIRQGTASDEIARLYVRKPFLGRSVGKTLMQASIALAIENRKTSIWLGVWEHNERAIAFYRSFGFVRTGKQDFVLGTDVQRDWVMEKQISLL